MVNSRKTCRESYVFEILVPIVKILETAPSNHHIPPLLLLRSGLQGGGVVSRDKKSIDSMVISSGLAQVSAYYFLNMMDVYWKRPCLACGIVISSLANV